MIRFDRIVAEEDVAENESATHPHKLWGNSACRMHLSKDKVTISIHLDVTPANETSLRATS